MLPRIDPLLDSAAGPDPAHVYERSNPMAECGEDRLDADPWHKHRAPDRLECAVHNAHLSTQINADPACDAGASCPLCD